MMTPSFIGQAVNMLGYLESHGAALSDESDIACYTAATIAASNLAIAEALSEVAAAIRDSQR